MGDHNANSNGTSRRVGRKRSSNEDDLTDEERCKKQKNREAAKRCRLRKIEESKNLKKQNEDLENQNRTLTLKKVDLESKILQCINVIKQHQQHGCRLPDDVQGILNSDSERFTSSDECPDFLPVGTHTIHRNQGTSSRLPHNETLSIQITENSEEMTLSDSRIPTGLFSGTEIQMDQSKIRMPKSQSPVVLAAQKKDIVTVSDSHARIQSNAMPFKDFNSIRSQNGFLQAEDGEGHDQSLSPVQRVPNIDQVPWSSPSPKANGADESGDDEYFNGSRSDAFRERPQTVNLSSSYDKLSGGFMLSNPQNQVAMGQIGNSHKTDNEVKPFQMISNANTAPKPFLASFKPNRSSVTQSLQVTTELISQAIHDIDPSEISQSFHAQIVEYVKPDSAISSTAMMDKDYLIPDSSSSLENQEEITQEAHQQFVYEYDESKPQQLKVIHHQTDKLSSEEISNIPVSYGSYTLYENFQVANPNILPSSAHSSTFNEMPGINQNYIITDKSGEHPGQAQVVTLPISILLNAANQIQQTSQPVEEMVENSQIPTTVLTVVEENETSVSEQNASEKMASSHVGEDAFESTENVNITSSADNYSANVAELPSLSFVDLQNTPKEIFDKKPSRLRGK